MATVYLAHDLRSTSRPVAIKVLHPELANALGPDRFLREIRIAAGLKHPNILRSTTPGPAPPEHAGLYYAMPFVEGESLRGRLRGSVSCPWRMRSGLPASRRRSRRTPTRRHPS